MVLPPFEMTNWAFFKDIIAGKKKTIRASLASPVKVTKFNELSTKFALEQVKKDFGAREYVPETWFLDKAKVSREFLFLVLSTVKGTYISDLVRYAHKIREEELINSQPSEVIQVCDEVAQLLKSVPYQPSK